MFTVGDLKSRLAQFDDSLLVYLDRPDEYASTMEDVFLQSDEDGEFVILTSDPEDESEKESGD